MIFRLNTNTEEQDIIHFYKDDYEIEFSQNNIEIAFGAFTTHGFFERDDSAYVAWQADLIEERDGNQTIT